MIASRTLSDVRLVSFEIIEGEDAAPNCTGANFTAVLEAEPFIYGEPLPCIINGPWDLDPDGDDAVCFDWNCDSCPQPPPLPAPDPDDPCAPQPPVPSPEVELSSCWCEPIVSARQCCQVTGLPAWMDSVLRITVYTGNKEMKNARIRLWPTLPVGESPATPDGREAFKCLDACAVAEITRIPAYSTLVIDGVARTIKLRLPGQQPFNADNLVFGPSRTLWGHPVLACGAGYWACMDVDIFNTGTDATLTLEIIPREIG